MAGVFPNPGGRPKGTPNKRTALRKATLDHIFAYMGGMENYQKWCKRNEDFIYQEYTKMLIKERLNQEGLNIDANVTFKWAGEDGANNNGPL